MVRFGVLEKYELGSPSLLGEKILEGFSLEIIADEPDALLKSPL